MIEKLENIEIWILFKEKILKWLNKKNSKKYEEIFNRAYFLSKAKFKHIFRDSWENYFEHLERTSLIILKEFPNPTFEKVILALLHDIYEDTSILDNTINLGFWENILENIKYLSKNDERIVWEKDNKKLYFERLLKCTDETIIDVKLADRIDNLRTIWCWGKEKIIKKIKETEKYIIPLAENNLVAKKLIIEEINKIKLSLNLQDTPT